jgi:hypothetical protein
MNCAASPGGTAKHCIAGQIAVNTVKSTSPADHALTIRGIACRRPHEKTCGCVRLMERNMWTRLRHLLRQTLAIL